MQPITSEYMLLILILTTGKQPVSSSNNLTWLRLMEEDLLPCLASWPAAVLYWWSQTPVCPESQCPCPGGDKECYRAAERESVHLSVWPSLHFHRSRTSCPSSMWQQTIRKSGCDERWPLTRHESIRLSYARHTGTIWRPVNLSVDSIGHSCFNISVSKCLGKLRVAAHMCLSDFMLRWCFNAGRWHAPSTLCRAETAKRKCSDSESIFNQLISNCSDFRFLVCIRCMTSCCRGSQRPVKITRSLCHVEHVVCINVQT